MPNHSDVNDHDRTVETVESACRDVASGKLAARRLRDWIATSGVNEIEFRLIWQLRSNRRGAKRDDFKRDYAQTCLAQSLAVSPAQVSATVERLRRRGLVQPLRAGRDRRRQCWRLTDDGEELLSDVLACVAAALSSKRQEAA